MEINSIAVVVLVLDTLQGPFYPGHGLGVPGSVRLCELRLQIHPQLLKLLSLLHSSLFSTKKIFLVIHCVYMAE